MEIKQQLELTNRKASNNLKHRILHQIEEEQVIRPTKRPQNIPGSYFTTVFGTMYLLLIFITVHFCSTTDGNPFLSSRFLICLIGTAGIFSIIWMLFNLLDYRKHYSSKV